MDITKYLIRKDTSIKDAMKKIDKGAKRIVFVVDEAGHLLGSLSDGDIRRYILKTGSIEGKLEFVFNASPFAVSQEYNLDEIRAEIIKNDYRAVPVLDADKKVVDILFWEDILEGKARKKHSQINLPVVVMAGGAGTRLDPFTRILPKPLIPIGDKAMIEVIMDEFARYGIDTFYITINHKSKMIKAFFEENTKYGNIRFVEETKPLGTVGSLYYLKDELSTTFFVTNCDILIDEDYTQIYEFHKKGNYDLTLIAAMKNFTIPYGICELEHDGLLKQISEKPEFNFLVNTGMYILEPKLLSLIPKENYFDITDLIRYLKENNYRIGVFPVSDQSWIDVGQWEEYKNAIKKFEVIGLPADK